MWELSLLDLKIIYTSIDAELQNEPSVMLNYAEWLIVHLLSYYCLGKCTV